MFKITVLICSVATVPNFCSVNTASQLYGRFDHYNMYDGNCVAHAKNIGKKALSGLDSEKYYIRFICQPTDGSERSS